MDLIYILKLLYRKIWMITIIPLVAGISAYFFTQNIEKKYKSTAHLATGFTTKNRLQIANENLDYWESKSKFENLVELMKSDLVGSMVAYKLLLNDLNEPTPFSENDFDFTEVEIDSIKGTLQRHIDSFELLSSYNQFENEIIDILNKKYYNPAAWIKDGNLMISRIRDTDFVKVEFTSKDPFLSAFVVNELCEEYIRYNSEIDNAVAKESLSFLASEVEKKKRDLDEKTKLLNDFKNSSHVYNYEIASNSNLAQLTEYEIKLQEEENKLNGLMLSLKSLDSKIASFSGEAEFTDNTKVIELRSKINEVNKLYVDGGANDPDLAELLGRLRTQLQIEMRKLDAVGMTGERKPKTLSELKSEKDDIELQIAISNSNLVSIRSKINSLRGNVSTIGSKESTILSLERERENAYKDYSSYVEKLNEARSKSLINNSGIKVMITGQPNSKPEPSKRFIFIALAIMASFSLCVGSILLMEFFDNRLKTPEKFERIAKVKLLGYMNQLSAKSPDTFHQAKKEVADDGLDQLVNLLRKIRFNIENSGTQVLLVSSGNKGDGKSFFIKSLAKSISLLGRKTLIIDTNFRNNSLSQLIIGDRMLQKPSQYKLLNETQTNGDSKNIEEEYSMNIIFPTSDRNVDIIGSKRGNESPSEMFAGRDFVSLINSMRVKYDYILLEGPSLNDYSDTKELTQFVDGVVGVFSAQSSITPKDRESIKYFKSLNGKFIGAILNYVQEREFA